MRFIAEWINGQSRIIESEEELALLADAVSVHECKILDMRTSVNEATYLPE